MEKIFTHILPNGLRLVHEYSASQVAYCGLAVNVGSRDEATERFGLAHFVEHTIFKGTKHRRSCHIINRMERVGGEINAYTSKEETVVYSVFPSAHYSRALELIADLVQHSVFPEAELDKERDVVLDEVNSYLDTPSEAVYDDFEDLVFEGSGLGHNILGNEAALAGFTSGICREFIDSYYVPENMVLFSSGSIPFGRLCRMAEHYFGSLKHRFEAGKRVAPSVATPFSHTRDVEGYQSHTIYGAPLFGMYDRRKYAMSLLNNIIGGPGMNSLLNVALRERRGYVYTVESNVTHFTDCGEFCVYFGCDAHHTDACLRIIGDTISRIADAGVGKAALQCAKRQYVGQLLVASENRENMALSLGKSMLFFNRVSSFVEISDRILAVTSDEIRSVAELLVPSRASVLTFR